MFLIREVVNCKPGKVGELLKKFKAVSAVMDRMDLPRFRLFTDVSGEPFWTVVAQLEVETINDFRDIEGRVMGDDEARAAMAGYHDLVLQGRREIYKIED